MRFSSFLTKQTHALACVCWSKYSNHLNTGLVRYSNGGFVSGCEMVLYSNGGLKTGLKKPVLITGLIQN